MIRSQTVGSRPGWVVDVRWPDGERAQLEVHAEDASAAEEYARDIWGESVTVAVTPAPAAG